MPLPSQAEPSRAELSARRPAPLPSPRSAADVYSRSFSLQGGTQVQPQGDAPVYVPTAATAGALALAWIVASVAQAGWGWARRRKDGGAARADKGGGAAEAPAQEQEQGQQQAGAEGAAAGGGGILRYSARVPVPGSPQSGSKAAGSSGWRRGSGGAGRGGGADTLDLAVVGTE